MNVRSLITQAAALFGSEAALGRATGFSQNAIWQAKRSDRVTAEMAVAIHDATRGKIPKWALRPDLWDDPAVLEPARAPTPAVGAAA